MDIKLWWNIHDINISDQFLRFQIFFYLCLKQGYLFTWQFPYMEHGCYWHMGIHNSMYEHIENWKIFWIDAFILAKVQIWTI